MSISDSIMHSRSTLLINMIIQFVSVVILMIGIFYVIGFLTMRRHFMEPVQYKIYIVTISLIGCVWCCYVYFRIRTEYRIYRTISEKKDSVDMPEK